MEKGDIAVISYTATDKTNDKVFDSTIKEQAEKAGIFNEKITYEPLNIIIGNKELMPQLEEEITKMKAGEEKKILLKPEQAFGERKAEMIKVLPLKEFISREIRPVPGLPFELNNMRGKVQSVSGGRVRVDFNHELAGKEIEYDVKLEKLITEKKDKLEAIKEKFFMGTNAKIKEEKNEISVEFNLILPQPHAKANFTEVVFSNFEEIKKINFIESLKRQEETKGKTKEEKKSKKVEPKEETEKEQTATKESKTEQTEKEE